MELRCRKRPRVDYTDKAHRLTEFRATNDNVNNNLSCNGNNALDADYLESGCGLPKFSKCKQHMIPDGKTLHPLHAISLSLPDHHHHHTQNGWSFQHNGYHNGHPLAAASSNGLTVPVVRVNGFTAESNHFVPDVGSHFDACCPISRRVSRASSRIQVCDAAAAAENADCDSVCQIDLPDGVISTSLSNASSSSTDLDSCENRSDVPQVISDSRGTCLKVNEQEHESANNLSAIHCPQRRDIRKFSHLCKEAASSASSLSSDLCYGSSVKEKATCQWNQCGKDVDVDALLEHITRMHIESQVKVGASEEERKFVCLWNGCKVYNRSSTLQTWLERHVVCHLGDKPYRCIVAQCRMRFASQFLLTRHVNGHFTGLQSRPLRKGDTLGRQMKRRKLKNTRPCPVKTDDYFDSATMESIQNKLVSRPMHLTQVDLLHSGNSITFHSFVTAKRAISSSSSNGQQEVLLRWSPQNILPDEWIPESQVASYTRQVIAVSSLPEDALQSLTQPHLRYHRNKQRKNSHQM